MYGLILVNTIDPAEHYLLIHKSIHDFLHKKNYEMFDELSSHETYDAIELLKNKEYVDDGDDLIKTINELNKEYVFYKTRENYDEIPNSFSGIISASFDERRTNDWFYLILPITLDRFMR